MRLLDFFLSYKFTNRGGVGCSLRITRRAAWVSIYRVNSPPYLYARRYNNQISVLLCMMIL